MKHLYYLFLTLLMITTVPVAASDIILLLEAKEDAQIMARVDSADPVIKAASPVLESEKATHGWMWTEYSTTIKGYVPAKSLSKNFDIAPNTIVRSGPNKNARVLTLAEATDRFEVLASDDDDWATIRFNKAIPVYFLDRPLSVPVPASKIQPRQKRHTRIQFNPDRAVSNLSPNALPPENVVWSSASANTTEQPEANIESLTGSEYDMIPATPDSIIVMPTQVQAPKIPRAPEVKVGTPIRILTGKLVREIHNFGPRYPIRLKSASGQRVAYVDMSRIFINDLRPYLDKTVYIRGEVQPIVPGSRNLVILARTIRITE
jgi:hypothetical protein